MSVEKLSGVRFDFKMRNKEKKTKGKVKRRICHDEIGARGHGESSDIQHLLSLV